MQNYQAFKEFTRIEKKCLGLYNRMSLSVKEIFTQTVHFNFNFSVRNCLFSSSYSSKLNEEAMPTSIRMFERMS